MLFDIKVVVTLRARRGLLVLVNKYTSVFAL